MGETEIGRVSDYFEHVGVIVVTLNVDLKVGDKIRIVGADGAFEQDVESMQINRVSVEEAEQGDMVGIKVNSRVKKGSIVYKI